MYKFIANIQRWLLCVSSEVHAARVFPIAQMQPSGLFNSVVVESRQWITPPLACRFLISMPKTVLGGYIATLMLRTNLGFS